MSLRYAKYHLNYNGGGVDVMVGNRPDFTDPVTRKFFDPIDVRISVTDQMVFDQAPDYNIGGAVVFCPWIEELPPNEMLVAAVYNLNYWIEYNGSRRIYLHCDAGTHRSVSVFGLWLLAYNRPKEWAKPTELVWLDPARKYDPGHWSDPLRYAETYMTDPKCPWVPEAMKLLGQDKPQEALVLAANHKYQDEDHLHFLKQPRIFD